MQKPHMFAVLCGELQEPHDMEREAGLHMLPHLRAIARQSDKLLQGLGPRQTVTPLHAPCCMQQKRSQNFC